jgi:two-component system response regulator CpxR
MQTSEILDAGGLRLLPSARAVLCEGSSVSLTGIEYDILELLVRAAGRIVTRDELTTVLYQRRATPFDRALDVHISHLRRKLGRRGAMILTVRGAGYRFHPVIARDAGEGT